MGKSQNFGPFPKNRTKVPAVHITTIDVIPYLEYKAEKTGKNMTFLSPIVFLEIKIRRIKRSFNSPKWKFNSDFSHGKYITVLSLFLPFSVRIIVKLIDYGPSNYSYI